MSQDPLRQDGLRPIIYLTLLWAAALLAEFLGILNWNRTILFFGVLIGIITISFLTFRRFRLRQR